MANSVIRVACAVAVAVLLIASMFSNNGEAQSKCGKRQFLAKYYTNEKLTGEPLFTTCETRIDTDWGKRGPNKRIDTGKPDTGSNVVSVGNDHFSIEYSGEFYFEPGPYTFIATADDGIRVYVDREIIIDEWRVQGVKEFQKQKRLTMGNHTVTVRYFENVGGAVARVRWFKT